jgi:hypothetical protein
VLQGTTWPELTLRLARSKDRPVSDDTVLLEAAMTARLVPYEVGLKRSELDVTD